ncbi:leucyl aminopeptidase [Actinomyces ruminicola]|uniref:Probable cytosol aminopeptidase n=1 Tax=Actinomyces ruminicola TaxID=332524 RepID=A0A1G9Y2I4_9ACTO|nr:leucyl aminopeptidase [Actinomyces ruminicola]SDN03230.1 leucyl aminopeptidase [Actinomyces ruminicola]
MTAITTSSLPPAAAGGDVLVLAARAADGAPALLTTDAALDLASELGVLAELLPSLGFTGATDALVRVPAAALGRGGSRVHAPTLLVVGTGDASDTAALRRAAGRAARDLAGTGHAVFALPADTAEELAAVAEGALEGAYAWSRRVPEAPTPLARVTVLTPLAPAPRTLLHRNPEDPSAPVIERARILAEAVAAARDLVNDPPARLTPVAFADHARREADGVGRGQGRLDFEVYDERRLADEGFGAIAGVGQGAVHPPRLVRLEWTPKLSKARRRAAAHVALVGKGITFDSGGLSLKPPASMPAMKSDMAGAATVLSATLAAARLGLPVRVTAWLALAENLPGGAAQRPGDIVTMFDGTTVEVTNTDAEGRLVMADALAAAVAEEPDVVLDVATLTGAQIVALGERTAGVMGQERDAVVAAAARAGEDFWPMPLPEHLRANLDSPFADLRNAAVGNRAGGMLVAGLFLSRFVGDTPWAHLDIAGPAYNEKAAWGLTPQGGTGFGVPTLLTFLEERAAVAQAAAD